MARCSNRQRAETSPNAYRSGQRSLGIVFACVSITTSRVIKVRAPDRGSLGLGLGLGRQTEGH